jgi:hypothetical protein
MNKDDDQQRPPLSRGEEGDFGRHSKIGRTEDIGNGLSTCTTGTRELTASLFVGEATGCFKAYECLFDATWTDYGGAVFGCQYCTGAVFRDCIINDVDRHRDMGLYKMLREFGYLITAESVGTQCAIFQSRFLSYGADSVIDEGRDPLLFRGDADGYDVP